MLFNVQSGTVEKNLEANNHHEAAQKFFYSTDYSLLTEFIAVGEIQENKILEEKFFLTQNFQDELPNFRLVS